MKKTVMTLSALLFVLALVVSGTTWANDGPTGEGSATKTHKPVKKEGSDSKGEHSEEYKSDKASGMKGDHRDKKSDHDKAEEGSSGAKPMKAPAPKREGS